MDQHKLCMIDLGKLGPHADKMIGDIVRATDDPHEALTLVAMVAYAIVNDPTLLKRNLEAAVDAIHVAMKGEE